MKFTRRTAMEVLGVAAMPLAAAQVPPPPKEGKDTPKIALGMGDGGGGGIGSGRGAASNTLPSDAATGPRRIKQLGVDHVLGGGGPVPWTEQSLNETMERWKAVGISVDNLMINLSNDILYGKTGEKRDQDIE